MPFRFPNIPGVTVSPLRVAIALGVTFLCVAAAFSGCGAVGEKKVQVITVLEQQPLELTSVTIKGTLRDARGTPLSGVRVQAVTDYSNDWAYTNGDGRFWLRAKYVLGDAVHFRFQGDSLNFVESVESMPRGLDPLAMYFTANPDYTVRFSAYEY